jgi:hypothetical protein
MDNINHGTLTEIPVQRDGTGGDIMESIKTAKLFVKEGLIAKIHYYSQELEDMEYYSDLKKLKYNLIVFVKPEELVCSIGILSDSVHLFLH